MHAHLPANKHPSCYCHPKWCLGNFWINSVHCDCSTIFSQPPPNPLQPCGVKQWLRPNFHQGRVALPTTRCRRHRRGPARPAGWDAPPTPTVVGLVEMCRWKQGGPKSNTNLFCWSQLLTLSNRSKCSFRFKATSFLAYQLENTTFEYK